MTPQEKTLSSDLPAQTLHGYHCRSSFFHPVLEAKDNCRVCRHVYPGLTTIREIEGYCAVRISSCRSNRFHRLGFLGKRLISWLLSHSKILEIETYFRYR